MLKQNPGSATLISRTLCYFEQNANFIMPAYRFRVQIVGTNGEVTGGDIFILIGLNCPEFVGKSEFFGFPPPIPNSAPHAPAPPPLVNNVRLGEYVVRQDADQDICLNIANDFAGSAAFGSSIIGKSVTRTQYYWDEPWLWTPALGIADNSRFYPGSVDFAVIIAHGTGWEFSCLSNYGEWVDLHTMDHYGRNAPVGNVDQDYTSYMLFTSCDMIPAPGDPYSGDYTSGSPFDVWWNIFYGFHGIYGFRATAGKQACDDMFSNFALAMGVGQPNCAAWMNVTGSEDHGGGWNYGTAVIMSGFEGDTIYNTDARGAAGSLTIWWNHP